MERKIELDKLSEKMFTNLMSAVNDDILAIGREAQDKINKLLTRFNIRCEITLNYGIISCDKDIENLEAKTPSEVEAVTEIKKVTKRKKTKVSDPDVVNVNNDLPKKRTRKSKK